MDDIQAKAQTIRLCRSNQSWQFPTFFWEVPNADRIAELGAVHFPNLAGAFRQLKDAWETLRGTITAHGNQALSTASEIGIKAANAEKDLKSALSKLAPALTDAIKAHGDALKKLEDALAEAQKALEPPPGAPHP